MLFTLGGDVGDETTFKIPEFKLFVFHARLMSGITGAMFVKDPKNAAALNNLKLSPAENALVPVFVIINLPP